VLTANPRLFLATILLFLGGACSFVSPGNRGRVLADQSAPKILFRYSDALYAAPECRTLPKKVDDDQIPFNVGPKRWSILLKSRSNSPHLSGIIYLTPLSDHTVRHFDTVYSQLSANAQGLRTMLGGPREDVAPRLRVWGDDAKGLPDEPWCDAGEGLKAKFRWLDSPQMSGFRVLVYYAQGNGDVLEKDNLFYNFQGITKDGRYYISARLGVRNPALDRWKPTTGESRGEVEAEQRHVNSWKDESFVPNLGQLDQMIASVELATSDVRRRLGGTTPESNSSAHANGTTKSEETEISFLLR
jgi:hypothetical protein